MLAMVVNVLHLELGIDLRHTQNFTPNNTAPDARSCNSVYFFSIYPLDGKGTIKPDPPHLYGTVSYPPELIALFMKYT